RGDGAAGAFPVSNPHCSIEYLSSFSLQPIDERDLWQRKSLFVCFDGPLGCTSNGGWMTPDRTRLDELRIDRAARPRTGTAVAVVAAVVLIAAVVMGLAWWFSWSKAAAVRTVAVR